MENKRFLTTPLFATRCLIKDTFKGHVGKRRHNKRLKCVSLQCIETDPDSCFSNPMLKNWQINQRMCCISPLSLVSKKVFKFE